MKKLVLALALVALIGGIGLTASGAQAYPVTRFTLDHNGLTVMVPQDDYFVLDLGRSYTWQVSAAPPEVVQMIDWTNGRRSWGLFLTHHPGDAVLTAYGTPNCEPCGMPRLQYTLTIWVLARGAH